MAKKNNKIPPKTNPVGFKTKGNNTKNNAPVSNMQTNEGGATIINNRKRITIIIVAAILVIALSLAIFFGFFNGNGRFDYIKRDLTKYITLSESDYKNIKVNIPLYEFEESMIDRAITDLLVENKSEKPLYDGTGVKNIAITLGDMVTLRFRGYTKDENGKETDILSLMNLTEDNDATLEVGIYENLIGLNEAFIGLIPNTIPTFEKIVDGVVEEGDVVYVSYSGSRPEEEPETVKSVRIDLSRTDLDEVYGVGFKDKLIGQKIGVGQSMITLSLPSGGTAMYVDLKVDFLTRCEDNPFVVEATYPPDYEGEKSLRGKTVYFDMYVKNAVIYDTPEYNEEFITKTLGLSAEDLSEFEGNTLIEKHRSSLKAELLQDIEEVNTSLLIEAIWEHLADKGEVIKYPESEVNGYYNSLLAELQSYYNANTSKYDSIDSAAIGGYGLESGADWQSYLRSRAELEVRDKLIFYYIFKEEGFMPNEEEYQRVYNEIVDHQVSLMIEESEIDFDTLSEEEYKKEVELLKEKFLDIVGDYGMDELIYREIGYKKMAEKLVIIE